MLVTLKFYKKTRFWHIIRTREHATDLSGGAKMGGGCCQKVTHHFVCLRQRGGLNVTGVAYVNTCSVMNVSNW